MFIKNDRGFTLVEMAVVIIIAGFIFIPLMSVFIQRDLDETKTENIESNDDLVSALNFFLRQNGRFPAPADPTLGPDSVNFGKEDTSIVPKDNSLTGALPTQALGLPFDQAVNAYGWKYIYSVTEDLTNAATFDGVGVLKVITRSGSVADAANTPFVLVNTGEDGKGAYNLYGQQNALTCSDAGVARDEENCDGDALFVEAQSYIKGNPSSAGYYDDKLSYGFSTQANDLWMMAQNNNIAGKITLTNRTLGNVGVNVSETDAKLHVSGDTLFEPNYTGQGGLVDAQDTIIVGNNLSVEETAEAKSQFSAERFYIGQYDSEKDASCAGAWIKDTQNENEKVCCTAGSYKYLGNDDKRYGQSYCKSAANECGPGSSGNVFDGTQCCARHELDKSGKCCPKDGSGHIDANGVCKG